MKTRWMKTVVKTSKQAAAPMPFRRGQRKSAGRGTLNRTASAA